MGLAIADALGVPVEFESRSILEKNPVVGMRSFGTYDQLAGTWSDDTSMTLCLVDSLSKGLNYEDIMEKCLSWFQEGKYSPHGEVFDIGITTRKALLKYSTNTPPLECGLGSEFDNGNGSLMRILPILYYLKSVYGSDFSKNKEAFEVIHNISSLTHSHPRSLMACGIYILIASNLLEEMTLEIAIDRGVYNAMEHYRNEEEFHRESKHFARLENTSFKNLLAEDIRSGGYVIDTLEAALWCLLNTQDYTTCVLKAVNLGDDTDTVAAVAGGLAGLRYGYESIPAKWRESIIKRGYIENLCEELKNSLESAKF
ncbi:MAG: ADP-ribosylglycohydrolase [Clostridium sp.]|nr:ADP-ribosylglycohydrolase [Clostridium sp.]